MIDSISALDVRVLETLYAVRDPLLVQGLIWLSEMGAVWTVCGLAICSALALTLYGRYAYAAGLCISVATSGIALFLIKGLAERARPPLLFQAYPEIWYSFPSAHAALAAALYGFLACMAWRMIPSLRGKIYALLLGALIIGIAFSRIYLGVHYASDVLAGLILGVFCAWLGLRFAAFSHKQ